MVGRTPWDGQREEGLIAGGRGSTGPSGKETMFLWGEEQNTVCEILALGGR
jgi:hypothetical protein